MATFVSGCALANGCARVVRVSGVQSIRELETCRDRKSTFDSAFHELSWSVQCRRARDSSCQQRCARSFSLSSYLKRCQPLSREDHQGDRAMGRTGYTCIRHVFCSLNVLIWLCACGILGAGLWLRLAYSGYTTLVPHYSFASADSLLLAAGCVTFVIAFFGCCGAWFQSRCMLITYFGLVILMFLAEFMLGTLAFIFREHLAKSLKDELLFGIEKHYNMTREPGTLPAIWDHIHTEFHCCGVRDYTDWFQIDAWPTEDRVPDSCCIQRERYCGRLDSEGRNKELWYKEGCSTAIQMWLVTRLHVVGTVGLVVAFLQLFGQVASMILFCTVRHKRSSHTYKSYDTSNT